jgi:hypothetical protein
MQNLLVDQENVKILHNFYKNILWEKSLIKYYRYNYVKKILIYDFD